MAMHSIDFSTAFEGVVLTSFALPAGDEMIGRSHLNLSQVSPG